ncbi:MAG: NPCBM/NEW2 domain-containing protein [Candidatus Bruticola sp.]
MNKKLRLGAVCAFASLMLCAWAGPALSDPAAMPLLNIRQKYFANCMRNIEHTTMGASGNTSVESYITGLGGADAAIMQFEVNGKFDMFESWVGFSSHAPDSRVCTFELWADNVLITKVGPLRAGDQPDILKANIKGAKTINLRMIPGKYNGTASAMWGDPKLLVGVEGTSAAESLVVHVNGELFQATPSKTDKGEHISIPFPIQPGLQEYTVITNYNKKDGRVDIQYNPAKAAE